MMRVAALTLLFACSDRALLVTAPADHAAPLDAAVPVDAAIDLARPLDFTVCFGLPTCSMLAKNCGTISNNCGDTIDCGKCPPGLSCGAGWCGQPGVPNVCGGGDCCPFSCAMLGANCGIHGDGCGGILNCGTCVAPKTCGGDGGVPGVCG